MLQNVKGVDGIYCLITDKIDAELLDAAGFISIDLLSSVFILLFHSLSLVYCTGPQLKVVGTMSVGVDHVDMTEIKSRGIRLGYTPNVLTDATAETTIICLLAAARRVFEAHEELIK